MCFDTGNQWVTWESMLRTWPSSTEVVFKQQPRGLLRENQFVLEEAVSERFQIEVRH